MRSDHAIISRRQIDIDKENQCQHENFDVTRFNMTILDEPQFAVQHRMWTKKPPTANSVNQSSRDVWRSYRYWKIPHVRASILASSVASLVPLDELQSPV